MIEVFWWDSICNEMLGPESKREPQDISLVKKSDYDKAVELLQKWVEDKERVIKRYGRYQGTEMESLIEESKKVINNQNLKGVNNGNTEENKES